MKCFDIKSTSSRGRSSSSCQLLPWLLSLLEEPLLLLLLLLLFLLEYMPLFGLFREKARLIGGGEGLEGGDGGSGGEEEEDMRCNGMLDKGGFNKNSVWGVARDTATDNIRDTIFRRMTTLIRKGLQAILLMVKKSNAFLQAASEKFTNFCTISSNLYRLHSVVDHKKLSKHIQL